MASATALADCSARASMSSRSRARDRTGPASHPGFPGGALFFLGGVLIFSRYFGPEHSPVLHHEAHPLQLGDVLQRIALDGDDIGVSARRDHAHLALNTQQ